MALYFLRSWQHWVRLLLLWGILIGLQIRLWQPGGLLTTYRLHQQVVTETQQLTQDQKRNQALASHLDWLTHHKEAIEHYARQDLGMIKPGETYYVWVEKTP